MGRTAKKVVDEYDLDRREVGYYSTPKFVAEFIAERIFELCPDAKFIFDPCIGRGELTSPFKMRGCHVTGYDIVNMAPSACDVFVHDDFLKTVMDYDPSSLFHVPSLKKFRVDAIVANPPYNCHEVDYIKKQKSQLSARFGKATALNMYALFVRAIIEFAPEGCFIGLITHDSFLTAVGHQELRRYVLDNCIVHDLHLCPTNLFLDQGADVRTCLLVLKKSVGKSEEIRVSNRTASSLEFAKVLHNKAFDRYPLERLLLGDVRDNNEITVGVPTEIASLFKGQRLSEIAPCITGISTGDDRKYIRTDKSVDFSMPFYKNPASRKFYSEPDGYLCSDFEEQSRRVPNFIVRNRDLILRGGISCSSMGVKFGATIRPSESACGVNANIVICDERKWWLLSYLNSRLCFYLTKGIIIRGNMITAGYVSRIPVPSFNKIALESLTILGMKGFHAAEMGEPTSLITNEIDLIIESELDLSPQVVILLQEFSANPVRLA